MKGNKKIITLIIVGALCAVCAFAIFASGVFALFNKVKNDPTTKLVAIYIYDNVEFAEQYGEVTAVNHMTFEKEKKTEDYMRVPYAVETEKTKNFLVYFTLEKENEEWVVTDMEVIKRLRDSDK